MHAHRSLAAFVPPLALLLVAGCGGPDPDADRGSGAPSTVEGRSDAPHTGLWVEGETFLLVHPDGRYAAFRANEAAQDLRYADSTRDDRGRLHLPGLLRGVPWTVEDGALVARRDAREGEPAPEPARVFQRPTDAQRTTYWTRSLPRLVREGDVAALGEMQAAGHELTALAAALQSVDAPPVDLLAEAVAAGQTAAFDHLVDAGLELSSSGAAEAALERGDPELLAHVLDRGFPVQDALARSGTARRLDDTTWMLLIERGYAFGDTRPLLGADCPRAGSYLVENDLFDDFRMLAPVAAAGRSDLIEKVVAASPELRDRPELLYQVGVLPAIAAGELGALRTLQGLGSPLDQFFGRQGAMNHAVPAGDVDVLNFLAENGVDANGWPRAPRSPLDTALEEGAAPEVIEALLRHGATVEPRHVRALPGSKVEDKEAVKRLFDAALGQ